MEKCWTDTIIEIMIVSSVAFISKRGERVESLEKLRGPVETQLRIDARVVPRHPAIPRRHEEVP